MILIGHANTVRCIAYSANGHLLASGSEDRTVRIWDAAIGNCRSVIQHFNGQVRGVDFDDKHLVTGCQDGSVLKWELSEDKDQLHVRLCWSATSGSLMTQGISIGDVRGLSIVNTKLLKQRGAIGEPKSVMRSMDKIVRMASVVSKLRQQAGNETESVTSITAILCAQQPEPLEQQSQSKKPEH
jgi:WD40 repeat protein